VKKRWVDTKRKCSAKKLAKTGGKREKYQIRWCQGRDEHKRKQKPVSQGRGVRQKRSAKKGKGDSGQKRRVAGAGFREGRSKAAEKVSTDGA